MFRVEFNDGTKKSSTKLNFTIEENSAGGDCLFKTIIAFLKTTKESRKFEGMNDLDIRRIIVCEAASEYDHERMEQIKFNLEAHVPFFESLNLEVIQSNVNLQKEALFQYAQYMSTKGNEGTFVELEIAAKLFIFAGLIFKTNDKISECFKFGFSDNVNDDLKPKIFILFTGATMTGHFRLLTHSNNKVLTNIPIGIYEVLPESSKRKNQQIIHIRLNAKDNINEPANSENDMQCDICKQYCKGKRGLTIHITKKHKTQRRKEISTKYDSGSKVLENNEGLSTNKNDFETSKTSKEDVFNGLKSAFESHQSANELDVDTCESSVSQLVSMLIELQNVLPGPKNPNTKYYEMRKKKHFQSTDRKYSQSTNPQRQSKRDREKRKQKHQKDLIQWMFYNQRKTAVRMIYDDTDNICPIPINELYDKFQERWGIPNDNFIPQDAFPRHEQIELDEEYDFNVKSESVYSEIMRTSSDTSPGPDRIIPRTIKQFAKPLSQILARLTSIMIKWNYVPSCFMEARTILLYKEGDRNNVKNWRPITICSILRRIIEKVLDKQLRSYLLVSSTQHGFTNEPGTLLNTSILSAALNTAKTKKSSLVAVLLDVRQAYDKVSHNQLQVSMEAQPLPSLLRNLALKLDKENYTEIVTMKGKTKRIHFKCGLMQGAPTSPQKFNVSTKVVLDELNEREIQEKYGFVIYDGMVPITNLAFADDTLNMGNSRVSAVFLVSKTIENFVKMGLEINFEKSVAIIIENGELDTRELVINESTKIRALQHNETIRYLGTTFADEIILNEKDIITGLNNKLNTIVSTPTLRSDQKMQIINMYILPAINFPFQVVPAAKFKKVFLTDLDKIIRHATKEILQIPDDTPTSMIYSSTSLKGLGLIQVNWEAFIQNINGLVALKKTNHPIINSCRSLDDEIKFCLRKLNLPETLLEQENLRKSKASDVLRASLRESEFEKWRKLKTKGKGISLFTECPKINRNIYAKKGLTTTEWISYWKMVGNVAPNRSIPGRTTGTNRCRINNCNEVETLAHVLGSCNHGELIRLTRHNNIVKIIANALRKLNWIVVEEFWCLDSDGSNRRVDILAYNEETRCGYIIDPTVRFENGDDQPLDVHDEKKRIYEPCVNDVKLKCKLKDLEVIGILIGARGTLPKFFYDFCKKFKITSIMDDVAIEAVRGSCKILQNHFYDPHK